LLNRRRFRLWGWLLAAVVLIVFLFLFFGSNLLIAQRPPTEHVDAAIVLQGSVLGEKVRTAGAMHLLEQGTVERVVLSVPRESYWGQSIPAVARPYLERTFGPVLAAHLDFCETGDQVDSTIEEMQALAPCIRQHQWHSIVIVTSKFHTRRAGMIWKKLAKQNPDLRVSIVGVDDPEFQQPWWRHRQSAKIFVMEFTKLVWTECGGDHMF
jgi:uncharacterized SAM-binding protein YcdF (DUF218 family)